ncbi:hypothetical protein NUM3379_01750 [Kineococcus sp. NUM-3379]
MDRSAPDSTETLDGRSEFPEPRVVGAGARTEDAAARVRLLPSAATTPLSPAPSAPATAPTGGYRPRPPGAGGPVPSTPGVRSGWGRPETLGGAELLLSSAPAPAPATTRSVPTPGGTFRVRKRRDLTTTDPTHGGMTTHLRDPQHTPRPPDSHRLPRTTNHPQSRLRGNADCGAMTFVSHALPGCSEDAMHSRTEVVAP